MTADAIAPPTLAAALAARPTSGTATIVEAPAALRALATATLLEAVVTARDAGGLVSLRTDAGTVVLRGAAHLAPGTSVSLQLPQAASGPATVTANPSERPQGAAAPTATPLDPAPRLGGSVTVTATVLSPPPSRAPAELLADRPGRVASDASPTLPRGAYQAAAVEPPVAGARAAPVSPTVATETAGAARPAGAGEATLSDQHAESFSPAAKASDIRGDFARLAQRATVATPAPGATVELRLALPASPPSNAAERPLPATVLDRTPSGQTVLDTPIGRLAAMLPREYAAARAGTRLLFLWRPPEAAAPAPPAAAAREFGALRQALGALAESNLPAAQDAAKQVLPRPGPALARQMLEFVEAAERGARRWVGEAAAQALEKSGAGELLRQLDQSLRDAARQPAAAEWRHVVIPFADGAQLRPIDLWARRQRGRERDGKPREQSRFVVECAHDSWGEIQVDGLMTQGDDGTRLDVVLRTHAELPASLRAELAVGFADALGAMGVAGDIAFQAVAAFPPRPAPAPAHAVTA